MISRLDRTVDGLPRAYPGPGGAIAVMVEGEVVAQRTWGWANAERRIPFTASTLFRICSITKQFTCGLVLDAFPDPSVLDDDVRGRLPHLQQPPPGALHLCHNQSGLRDYWAVAMLQGAAAEQAFGEREAAEVIGGARTLQFEPGWRYSYANQNFRLLSDILQDRTGRDFAELSRTRLFDRIGMADACLAADTQSLPDGTEGYEGTQAAGFRVAANRIIWTGDAGLAASLDDMIAWERHIDATRDDPAALYSRLSAPVAFADGRPAAYGFGLRRTTELGRAVTCHGGALRGWRSYRLHAPSERISVVVLFNHMSDAHAAAIALFAAALDEDCLARTAIDHPPAWLGPYLEPETRLSARLDALPDGVRLRFGHSPEELVVRSDDQGLHMDRWAENLSALLRPCAAATTADISGRYACAELNAELTVVGDKGLFYGGFSGSHGAGRMELLEPIGEDVWALPCPRALDHTPPGDWTLAFVRDDRGAAIQVTVGCWLARGLTYVRS